MDQAACMRMKDGPKWDAIILQQFMGRPFPPPAHGVDLVLKVVEGRIVADGHNSRHVVYDGGDFS